jgi:hypothetical protein
MTAVLLRLLPGLAAAAALVAALWWAYDAGETAGGKAVQAKWDAVARKAAETRATELRETVTRMDALHLEVERLRARPARIKTITETIHVKADADCRSLPPDLRRLWDSADGDPDRPPAASARVDDAGVPAVAGDGR